MSEDGPAARAGVKVGDKLLEVCFRGSSMTQCVSEFIYTASVYKSIIHIFPVLSGKQCRFAWSRAPHGSGGLTELRNGSDHDCAT